MSIVSFEQRSLGRVVDQYIESKRNLDWPLSVASAVTAVRTVSPYPQLSDKELGSVIISAAVAKGRNVAFDLGSAQPDPLNPG